MAHLSVILVETQKRNIHRPLLVLAKTIQTSSTTIFQQPCLYFYIVVKAFDSADT